MNRMEDSVRLFKYIVSHPLLANTHIILLLNKVDLLKDKLRRGVQVSKLYVYSVFSLHRHRRSPDL